MKKMFSLKLWFWLVLISSPAIALDKNLPINIQSDTASFAQNSGKAIYTGNVILTQGEQVLYADKLILSKQADGRFNNITATGKPAKFTGKIENKPDIINAEALKISFYPKEQKLVLEGQATILYKSDKFTGPSLMYDLDKQLISAESKQNERPTITIQPPTTSTTGQL